MKQMKYIVIAVSLFLGLTLFSCHDFFNAGSNDVLMEEDYPTNLSELYGGYWGMAAKMQAVADQAIFLEGIRGDLLEPTQNASNDILDLYYYREDGRNKFADPLGFYEVVLNVNDFLSHAVGFYDKNPNVLDKATFDAILSGAVRYKCWAYLMLAKIYGEAVWMDNTITEYDASASYPTLKFDELIQKCIDLIENGTTVNGHKVDGKQDVRWTDILKSSDLQWNRICPTADCLLTELYLYAGQYQQVIDHGFAVLRSGAADSDTKPSFQITKSEWKGEWVDLFGDPYGKSKWRMEYVCSLPYSYELNETNHLIDYFSNDAGSHYLLRPSQAAMDRFNTQITEGGGMGDTYRGNGCTFKQINGEWTIYKYTRTFYPDNLYRNEPLIGLYRAPDIHFMLVEAMIQLGELYESTYLFDGGIESYYSPTEGKFIDRLDAQGNVVAKLSDFPVTLYSSNSDGSCQGIRGRVGLKRLGETFLKNAAAAGEDLEYKQQYMDSLLIEETCLESAAEARAYYTMVRIAKRWNKPEIVADRISAKYPEEYRAAIRAKLMDPDNWFIKRNLE